MRARIAALLLALVMAPLAEGAETAESCKAYKWDVSAEVTVYHQIPVVLAAGRSAEDAPLLGVAQLYQLTLQPQESVAFKAPPSKRMLSDGAYAGVLHLKLDRAGAYRVAIDSGYWLDVVQDGKPLASVDFNGSQSCEGPHKIVVYRLPAATDLYLQVSAVGTPQAKLSVTQEPSTVR